MAPANGRKNAAAAGEQVKKDDGDVVDAEFHGSAEGQEVSRSTAEGGRNNSRSPTSADRRLTQSLSLPKSPTSKRDFYRSPRRQP